MASTFFGNPNGIDTRDYIFKMDGTTPVSIPDIIVGHTLTSPNVDLSDALTVVRAKLTQGRIKTVTVTKRAPEEQGRQYTLGFPDGALWTPAMQLAKNSGCRSTFYAVYACPEDSRLEHAEIMPDALLDPITPEGDLIVTEEDALVRFTSTLRIAEQYRLWQLGFTLLYTEGSATPLHALAPVGVDCPSCADIPGLGYIVGGGAGVAAPVDLLTDDRFATETDISSGAAAAQITTAVAQDGQLVVVGTGSAVTPTALATGELRVSQDTGGSWSAIAAITNPIYGIMISGSLVIAVGGEGGAAAEIWVSFNRGSTFTQVTSAALSATEALTDIHYDEDADAYYVVGQGGSFYKVEVSGSNVTVTDLSANLPGAPGLLNAVRVLAQDHIMVGGAAGYAAESLDGGETFTQLTFAGANAIVDIAGTRFRTIAITAGNIYKRDVMTNYEFASVSLEGGVVAAGNYTKVENVETLDADFNMFAVVTDAGEFILGKPFYPNA